MYFILFYTLNDYFIKVFSVLKKIKIFKKGHFSLLPIFHSISKAILCEPNRQISISEQVQFQCLSTKQVVKPDNNSFQFLRNQIILTNCIISKQHYANKRPPKMPLNQLQDIRLLNQSNKTTKK